MFTQSHDVTSTTGFNPRSPHSLFTCLWMILFPCEELTPVEKEENSLEGSSVTLSYRYSKQAAVDDYFFWYRQYPGKPPEPEFLLYITEDGSIYPTGSDFLAHIDKSKKHVKLEISSAKVSDSAVYYCAVRPTVTGNTKTLYKNLWSKDNTILHNIHQRESHCSGQSQSVERSSTDDKEEGPMIVIQSTGDDITTEGETVTLGCTFVTDQTPTLYWYKQKENDYPKMLLQRFSVKTENAKAQERIDATIKDKSVPLKIQKLQLSDSAVYYCALQPTVTGNTKTLYKNLWSKDNTILHNVH
uniref:Ig-like domain-containing protein n=1 Tax=Sander lucioperca TaxID=283035 RepID=A0A8C9XRM2_SANLU